MENFKKCSFCSTGTCVEVKIENHLVTLRDAEGDTVIYTHAEWQAFIAGVKNGEFDI